MKRDKRGRFVKRRKNPVKPGYSRRTIGANIKREMKRGRKRVQSVAIALTQARAAWRRRHPGKRLPAHLARRKSNPRQPRHFYWVEFDNGLGRHYMGPVFTAKRAALTRVKRIAQTEKTLGVRLVQGSFAEWQARRQKSG